MRYFMVGFISILALSGCASNKFIANLDNAPTWFLNQVKDADQQGYPQRAATPKTPNDIPPLSHFDKELQQVKGEGQKVAANPRAIRSDMPTKGNTDKFVKDAREYTDVQKFNDEEETRLEELRAKKKKK